VKDVLILEVLESHWHSGPGRKPRVTLLSVCVCTCVLEIVEWIVGRTWVSTDRLC